MGKFLLFGFFGFAAICVLISAYRSGRFFLSIFLTALQGIAALFAVNVIGSLINMQLNINTFSLAVSSIFGTAGVILLLLIDTIIAKF